MSKVTVFSSKYEYKYNMMEVSHESRSRWMRNVASLVISDGCLVMRELHERILYIVF